MCVCTLGLGLSQIIYEINGSLDNKLDGLKTLFSVKWKIGHCHSCPNCKECWSEKTCTAMGQMPTERAFPALCRMFLPCAGGWVGCWGHSA